MLRILVQEVVSFKDDTEYSTKSGVMIVPDKSNDDGTSSFVGIFLDQFMKPTTTVNAFDIEDGENPLKALWAVCDVHLGMPSLKVLEKKQEADRTAPVQPAHMKKAKNNYDPRRQGDSFIRFVEAILKRDNMTINDLARKMDMNYQNVYSFLKKGTNPRWETLEALMHALSLKITE